MLILQLFCKFEVVLNDIALLKLLKPSDSGPFTTSLLLLFWWYLLDLTPPALDRWTLSPKRWTQPPKAAEPKGSID